MHVGAIDEYENSRQLQHLRFNCLAQYLRNGCDYLESLRALGRRSRGDTRIEVVDECHRSRVLTLTRQKHLELPCPIPTGELGVIG